MSQKLKFLLTSLFLFFWLSNFGQIKYEKGYLITTNNERIDCFIKDFGWKNNPEKIQYKLKQDEDPTTIFLDDLKEFTIPRKVKYTRKKVQIDRSPESLNKLTTKRGPIWSEEQLMLKVLIEGAATLYYYEDEEIKRFFFQKGNSDIEQLIYKAFYVSENDILYNNDYQQQLKFKLICEDQNEIDFSRLKYTKKDLIEYLEEYNYCINSRAINYSDNNNRLYNIKFSAGITNSSLTILNKFESSNEVIKNRFNDRLNFRISGEFEVIMPFNQNKWSLFTEISYLDYNASEVHDNYNSEASYKYYDLLFGARHYFFLSQSTKLFISCGAIISLPQSGSIKYYYYPPFELNPDVNSSIGFGIEYKKLSLACNYSLSRNIIPRYKYFESEFSTLSFQVGYKVF